MSSAKQPRPEDVGPTVSEKLDEWERQRGLRGTHRLAVYISVPITTGRAFLAWFRKNGHRLTPGTEDYTTGLRAHVVLPNVQHAAAFIELLRWRHAGLVIDPTAVNVPGLEQRQYHEFWRKVIERHVRRIVFLDGWEHSHGCTLEFETAQRLFLDCVDETLQALTLAKGLELLAAAINERHELGIDTSVIRSAYNQMRGLEPVVTGISERRLYKDEVLDRLAQTANVAQFVSFAPGRHLDQRYCRIRGLPPNHRFRAAENAVHALLSRSPEALVNIRTFNPSRPEGNPFERGLGRAGEVVERLRVLGGEEGLHTIVNETINESDGGVSGVAYRGVVEFAPDANPRCVDDEAIETAALPLELGMNLLLSVYGFEPDLRGRDGARVEFSVHPAPRGWMRDHTVIWQVEQRPAAELKTAIQWPNRFSRLLGDKAFGLALAAAAGLPVPRSFVFTRRLVPFAFGQSTGTHRYWTRTSPAEKAPGFYPSARGWFDPLAVLDDWRILGDRQQSHAAHSSQVPPLSSVLVQEAVGAAYSGRAVAQGSALFMIAGVPGEGDAFMVGAAGQAELPRDVRRAVREAHQQACDALGRVDIEWVFDGSVAWIVQVSPHPLVRRHTAQDEGIKWVEFVYQRERLEEFRQLAIAVKGSDKGILVIGNVSPLSHVGEIAEMLGVPVRFGEATG